MADALVPLGLVGAFGVEFIPVYTLPERTRTYARNAVRVDGGIGVLGDGLERPNPYEVIAEVSGTSLALAYASAYELVGWAEVATIVSTYEGTFNPAAFLGYRMNAVGPSTVSVALSWLPQGPT